MPPGTRRDEIVLATLRVLARDGVSAATTRAIAAEADVNVAMLHYYFGSKQALIAQVMDAVSDQIAATVRAAIPTDGGVRSALEHGLRATWKLVTATPGLQLAQYELTMSALRAEGGREHARQQYDAYRRVVGDLLNETLAASGEQLAVAVEELVTFLIAGMDGLILTALVYDDAVAADRSLELFVGAAVAFADPKPQAQQGRRSA